MMDLNKHVDAMDDVTERMATLADSLLNGTVKADVAGQVIETQKTRVQAANARVQMARVMHKLLPPEDRGRLTAEPAAAIEDQTTTSTPKTGGPAAT